jgi:uncharacterized delta-60 repeat protein
MHDAMNAPRRSAIVALLLYAAAIPAHSISASGTVEEAWVARYNGPGNDFDYAQGVAVDNLGNVYVAGFSGGSGTGQDYATIKYNSAGQEEWVAHYNGPANGDDEANAIAVDAFGNVYVTGFSGRIGTHFDCTTVKYNSSGEQLWVVRRNMVPPSGGVSDTAGKAIAVDSSGNVYVTGVISATGLPASLWVTIKYNESGEEQWITQYHGPTNEPDAANAIAVDTSGNVYVTGASSRPPIGSDYTTIKYNSAGQEEWVARYHGPVSSFDAANAIAVDVSGNAYVTGTYATIKYDSAGQEQWVAPYPNGVAYALAIDNSGNVFVTGQTTKNEAYPDYATIKYNASGEQQWVAYYNGPGNGNDIPKGIALDGEGNVYVTGISQRMSPFSDYDYATIKYDSVGQEQWVARYNGPGNAYEQVSGIAVDSAGNVYVTGRSGNGFDDDYVTIKYAQNPRPTPTPRSRPPPHPRPTSR